jgi:predicted PurR-regulated permease PerM
MILGFFMLWDLPTISQGVASLKNSRLAPVHAELAPVLTVFGKLFGRALEAQARIALVNTGLTCLGMWLLAIPGIGLLSLFVFICSFIPIAGVIISTTPIGFVALTEYGFIKLALVILMVTGVHFVEVSLIFDSGVGARGRGRTGCSTENCAVLRGVYSVEIPIVACVMFQRNARGRLGLWC